MITCAFQFCSGFSAYYTGELSNRLRKTPARKKRFYQYLYSCIERTSEFWLYKYWLLFICCFIIRHLRRCSHEEYISFRFVIAYWDWFFSQAEWLSIFKLKIHFKFVRLKSKKKYCGLAKRLRKIITLKVNATRVILKSYFIRKSGVSRRS